jgi:hypothetical protein
MDRMSCTLSPMVYAELYRLLAADNQRFDDLAVRLGDIGYSLTWLGTAADAYDEYWAMQLDFSGTGSVEHITLESSEHALLATWILAGLRNTGDDRTLNSALRTNVQKRAVGEVPDLEMPLPSVLNPVIYGWTLGQVVSSSSSDWPVAPASLPDDVNLVAAYQGLVNHVLALENMTEPWPEMMQTSTYWRGYGIAEALKPEAGSGGRALLELLSEARPLLSQPVFSQLNTHFTRFGGRRNALSHITDDAGRPERFVDVVAATHGWEHLRVTLRGLTQFVCQEASRLLYEEDPPPALRNDPWEYLVREISTDWWT